MRATNRLRMSVSYRCARTSAGCAGAIRRRRGTVLSPAHCYYYKNTSQRTMASHPDTKIDCSKVYVKRSSFATTEAEFDGAFAAVPIKKGTPSGFTSSCNR